MDRPRPSMGVADEALNSGGLLPFTLHPRAGSVWRYPCVAVRGDVFGDTRCRNDAIDTRPSALTLPAVHPGGSTVVGALPRLIAHPGFRTLRSGDRRRRPRLVLRR